MEDKKEIIPIECDSNVFERGNLIVYVDGDEKQIERFCIKVKEELQSVNIDWHRVAGRAGILYAIDYDKVKKLVEKYISEFQLKKIGDFSPPGCIDGGQYLSKLKSEYDLKEKKWHSEFNYPSIFQEYPYCDVVLAVEANEEERKLLQWQYSKQYENSIEFKDPILCRKRYNWKNKNNGIYLTIGEFGNAPVCLSIMLSEIEGKWVAFYSSESNVVNWDMIYAYLKKIFPKFSPFKKIYSSNFGSCFRDI